MKKIEETYQAFLAERNSQNLLRHMPNFTHQKDMSLTIHGQSYINYASNDYLGLSFHQELINRARSWAEIYGAGQPSSRLVTGNGDLFQQIERKIAKLKGTEAALLFCSGFQANVSVLAALFDPQILKAKPLIYADRLNHASMHMGCNAAGVRQKRYHHLDMDHLEQLLAQDKDLDQPKFILTETVFSMDGDLAPMKQLRALADQYGAFFIADDAHGTGILGKGGKGLSEGADLVIGTFSKAMGSFGAYVAGSQRMMDYLVQKASGLIYSTALPPMNLGAIDAALDLIGKLDEERGKVAERSEAVRALLKTKNIDTGRSKTQIIPLIVGESERALALADAFKDKGIWLTAIRPPTVPKGKARLRLSLSAGHSDEQLAQLLEAIEALL